MNEFLANGAEAVVILSFFFGIFSYAVLKPLHASIADLQECINDMRKDLAEEHKRREEIYRRLMLVEHDLKAAHERLDSLCAKTAYVLGCDDK